jgi:putative hydrolase of the HAD superfamily
VTAPRLEAVCFDYWNTLVHEDGTFAALRRKAWAERLGAAGVAVADHELDVAFEGAWRRFSAAWEANRQYVAADAARDLLAELGVEDPDGSLRAQLLEELHAVSEDAPLNLTPGIEACLRRLKHAGLRLGIVCDVGMTPSPVLRSHLERRGLLELFDHWSFSDEVGWYKPAPEIFRHALDGLGGIDPARAAHVGDLRRTDVAGAKAMGMLAVRYAGVSDDDSEGPEADVVVADHADLPAALGVTGSG